MINIYCDESCHLPHDDSPIMVIGGIKCPQSHSARVSEQIFRIKQQNGVYKYSEIKWTKVSESKLKMYKELADVFFNDSEMSFRAVIATGKQHLSLDKFNLSYDDWYQRIYYLLLREMIDINSNYAVYVDIKDTKGAEKIDLLKTVLNNALFSFYDETVQRVQLVRSDQIQLQQLADMLIGAVCYRNRELSSSSAKMELIDYIEERSGRPLQHTTPRSEEKFNLFKWAPRGI